MLRCIRFGEVLLDETFRTFLICNQCQMEFVEVPEFRVHLATTSCGQRLFKDDVIGLKFGAAQVTRASKEKTYLLYNPEDVQLATAETLIGNETTTDGGDDSYLDLIKIEEELLDPRWYTDIAATQTNVSNAQAAASCSSSGNANKPMEYKMLVEAVGPYVQFKTNAGKKKSHNIVVKRFPKKVENYTANEQNPERNLNPAVKRKLELPQKQVTFNENANVKYVLNGNLCPDVNSENDEIITGDHGAVLKRRKTINIPTDQVSIQSKSAGQTIRRSSDVPKRTTGQVINVAGTKMNTKPGALSDVTKLKTIPATKVRPAATAPKPEVKAHPTNLFPNPLATQKPTDGNKNKGTNTNLMVKNPATYAKLNSNGNKSEKSPTNRIPAINKVAPPPPPPPESKPQQRNVATTAITKIQPQIVAPAKQITPPALAPLSTNKITNPAAIVAAKLGAQNANQQTNDILNKLQTRGLQVKRTQPPCVATANASITAGQQNKTMELLQKLQSKGMKVKILNGKEAACATGATVTHLNTSIKLPAMSTNVGNVALAIGKQQQNKTILNNKLIIKKVK
ncbi:uncharacterized protein LOC101462843 [Ceratitis capitata]|uniref:uncharacterized protein LOC101462843 n=1 Tax=Ceratitis capitata TaxID=7213 RepID=UPI000329F1BF|nr:uncharacterized protein LOC101462843 [Ceratitis capitata]